MPTDPNDVTEETIQDIELAASLFPEFHTGNMNFWEGNRSDWPSRLVRRAKVIAAYRKAAVERECNALREEIVRLKEWNLDRAGQCACLEQKLATENATLLAWKTEQLQVESSWDCQAVGKEIGVTLGHSIRPAILPYLLKVKAELAEAMRALEGWNSFAIDAMRADPVMIERAMARDPKLRNDPALRQFITSILKD